MKITLRSMPFAPLTSLALWVALGKADAGQPVDIPVATLEALRYHDASNLFWGLNQLCGLALPLILLLSGWGVRLYEFVVRLAGKRSFVSLIAFATIYFVLDRLIRLPVAYLWDRAYAQATGAQEQALLAWLLLQASGWPLPLFALVPVVVFGYWLIAKSPRWWWLWASVATSLLVLAVLLAEPFTQRYEPLGDSPLEQRIAALAARSGIARAAIVIEHCDPPAACPPGRVIGLGPTRLMLLNDALLVRNPPAWTLQTVAHEAKHFARDDNLKALVLLSVLAVAALALLNFAGHAILARWSARLRIAQLAHPASLPLVLVLLGAVYLIVLPPVNAFRQQVELEADRFALELTRDNAAQAQMLASWALDQGRVVEWSHFFQLFRASHPSDASRIRLSNSYHPWLDGKPLVYADDFTAPPPGR